LQVAFAKMNEKDLQEHMDDIWDALYVRSGFVHYVFVTVCTYTSVFVRRLPTALHRCVIVCLKYAFCCRRFFPRAFDVGFRLPLTCCGASPSRNYRFELLNIIFVSVVDRVSGHHPGYQDRAKHGVCGALA
jgi:hypothetical protein